MTCPNPQKQGTSLESTTNKQAWALLHYSCNQIYTQKLYISSSYTYALHSHLHYQHPYTNHVSNRYDLLEGAIPLQWGNHHEWYEAPRRSIQPASPTKQPKMTKSAKAKLIKWSTSRGQHTNPPQARKPKVRTLISMKPYMTKCVHLQCTQIACTLAHRVKILKTKEQERWSMWATTTPNLERPTTTKTIDL